MTNKEISIFCNNVKVLRERNKLNKEEMAQICGITVPELMQIEQGSLPSSITVDIAIRLFRHFDISPEKLFYPL